MLLKYNILFVPHFNDRKKISPIRSKICKQVHSTQALQHPAHMSLISGGFQTKKYREFEKKLKEICKKEQPMKLGVEKFTAVLPDRFWTGIHIIAPKKIKNLQIKLQKLRNKYATKKETHLFHPLHITLAFPANVKQVKKIKCPFKFTLFDRIAVVKKNKENERYKIYKYIKFN